MDRTESKIETAADDRIKLLRHRLAVYERADEQCKGSLGLFPRRFYRDHFNAEDRMTNG